MGIIQEKIGDCAYCLQTYSEAQIHYEAALRHYRQKLTDTNELILTILIKSGDAYLQAHKHSLAERLYNEAIGPLKQIRGDVHSLVLHTVKNCIKAYEELMKAAVKKKNVAEVVRETAW